MKKVMAVLCALVSVGGALFFCVRLLNRISRTARENRREKRFRQVYTWERPDEEHPAENVEPEDRDAL